MSNRARAAQRSAVEPCRTSQSSGEPHFHEDDRSTSRRRGRRQAGIRPRRPQCAARRHRHHRRRPHPAVQPTVAKLAEAGARVIVASHLAAPRALPTRPSRWPPRPPGSANCSAPMSRRDRHRGRVRPGGRRPPRRRPGRGDREPPLQRRRPSKDDAERGAFADRLAALADVYVGDGFGAVHRKQHRCRPAGPPAARRRLPHRHRGRRPQEAHRGRQAPMASSSAAPRSPTSSA